MREGVVSPLFHLLSSLLLLSLQGNCPQLRYTHLDLLLFLLEPGFLLSSTVPCAVSDDLLIVLIRNELEGTITKGHPYVCESCVNILRRFFSSFLYQKIILIYFFF